MNSKKNRCRGNYMRKYGTCVAYVYTGVVLGWMKKKWLHPQENQSKFPG
jgi:hypothetical protein